MVFVDEGLGLESVVTLRKVGGGLLGSMDKDKSKRKGVDTMNKVQVV